MRLSSASSPALRMGAGPRGATIAFCLDCMGEFYVALIAARATDLERRGPL
jgi:hypothetical protein